MGKAPDRAVSTTAPRRYVRCSTDVCLPTEAYTSTVAIGVRCKDTFHPLGTGTLFQADTGPVCVTAAHVVKQAQLGPGELCIRAKGSQLFAIQNNLLWMCLGKGPYFIPRMSQQIRGPQRAFTAS
ncbi:MAG: hypothetical protein JRI90_10675 [Deltaproteobacteria bacterium]|nr:hypothetical protein [Deltaproteobacteria bacterium]